MILKGNYWMDAWNQKSQDHLFFVVVVVLTLKTHTRLRRGEKHSQSCSSLPLPPKFMIQRFLTFQIFVLMKINV